MSTPECFAVLPLKGSDRAPYPDVIVCAAVTDEPKTAIAAAMAMKLCLRINPPTAFQDLECPTRSEEHTSELQSLMRISYAVFCLKKKNYHLCVIQLTNTISTYGDTSKQTCRILTRYHQLTNI